MRTSRAFIASLSIAALLGFGIPAGAASKPKNATALCTDGSYSTAKTKQGACSRHGGIQTWYGQESTPAATAVPQNATAQCKDGTYSTAANEQGACSRHGGVQRWFGSKTAAPAAPATVPSAAPAPAPRPAPAPMSSAATPAPQNATARCKDGSLSFAKTHRGACSHHGGVAQWYR